MKIKVKALKDFIREALSEPQAGHKLSENWTSSAAMPKRNDNLLAPNIDDNIPAIIQPAVETQISDTDLPINDDKWRPGNLHELGVAMKQMAQHVPESEIKFVWMKLKLAVDQALNHEDPAGMNPRVEDINQKLDKPAV